MELERISIHYRNSYQKPGPDNPLIAIVKVKSGETAVETELPPETTKELISLVIGKITEGARVTMEKFYGEAYAIESHVEAVPEITAPPVDELPDDEIPF